MTDQAQERKCGSVSPLTNVPCDKPAGHSPDEGHGATIEMPDGRVNDMQWGARRQ